MICSLIDSLEEQKSHSSNNSKMTKIRYINIGIPSISLDKPTKIRLLGHQVFTFRIETLKVE